MSALIASLSTGLLSLILLTLPFLIGQREVQPSATTLNLCQRCRESHLRRHSTAEPPNAWRGLVPLHSTRVDVERVLGKPSWSHGRTFIYEGECERVNVLYSKGSCELSGVERWNVAADVVIKLEVAPRNKLMVKEFKLDLNRYLRDEESHPENWVQYRSLEDGIRIKAILDEKEETVMSIGYEPRTKDKPLKCSSTKWK